jgi:hypothetical protein
MNLFCSPWGRAAVLAAITLAGGCARQAASPSAASTETAPAALESGIRPAGHMDIATSKNIRGWAWDKNHPDSPVTVELYDGNILLGSVVADQFRQDLVKAGIGNGKHGFIFPTPNALKDGKPHQILGRVAGTKVWLNKQPLSITK